LNYVEENQGCKSKAKRAKASVLLDFGGSLADFCRPGAAILLALMLAVAWTPARAFPPASQPVPPADLAEWSIFQLTNCNHPSGAFYHQSCNGPITGYPGFEGGYTITYANDLFSGTRAYAYYPASSVLTCPLSAELVGEQCVCKPPSMENTAQTACDLPTPPAVKNPPESSARSTPSKKPEICERPQDGKQTPKPIIPATGEKILAQADYTGQGADALNLVRHYRSSWAGGIDRGLAVDPGLTRAWSHNHAVSIKQEGTAGTAGGVTRVIFGDGNVRTFSWNVTSSSWDAGNSADSLTANTTGLLYKRLDDDSLWQFDAAGKLLTVTQRNGWVNTYTYSTAYSAIAPAANLLVSVSNQFGRSLSFAYNGVSQLVSVTASDGQVTSYTYDGTTVISHLTTVSYPGLAGGTASRTYHYENTTYTQMVTGITDERGVRLATIAYDSQGRAISSAYAGGADLYAVSYGAAGVATVTDPLGTQRTYSYSTNKGQLAVTGADKPSGTGNSSAASRVQDANGFVTQETDFLGVNTMYTWDVDRRLPLTTTEAAALPEARTTSTQWHASFRLPVLVTEAGRSTAYSYDTQGNRLSQTVTDTASNAAQTTSWTYNPQGLVATQSTNNVVRQTYAYYTDSSFSGTAPNESNIDPELSRVSLLLSGIGVPGSLLVDSSPSTKPLTRWGNAQISTAQSKFGYSSIYFDGNRSSVSTPSATDFQFGAGDFTIETWVYQTNRNTGSYGAYQHVVGQYEVTVNSNTSFALLVADGRPEAAFWSGNAVAADVSAANPLPLNTWVHLAAVRSGNLVTLYVNGVSAGSAALTASLDISTRNVTVGADSARQIGLSGYLSDLRVTKGVARYTANFTPPVRAFSDTTPVIDPNTVGHTAGDLQSVMNAAGHVTQFTFYDRAGRVRQMVDPKGIVTDMTYTPRGWVNGVSVTPPGGTARITSYTYDNAGQLTGVTLPDGSTMSYSYDAAHRLTGVTDAKGNTVSYTLDAIGNKVGEQVKDPSGNLQRNITRVYDALNRVQQVTGASN
jgi:YD repeat-containing protein